MTSTGNASVSNVVLTSSNISGNIQYSINQDSVDINSVWQIRVIANGSTIWSINAQSFNNFISGSTSFSGNISSNNVILQAQIFNTHLNTSLTLISLGTFTLSMAPSPPSLSSGTYNPPQPDGSNFYLTTTTSVGTASISITVKKPGDTSFGFFLDHIPLSPNGIIPIQLPFSSNPSLYGTYSFQAQAFDSSGAGSQLSNIATITINPTNLLAALQAAIAYMLTRPDLVAAFPGTFTGNYAALINWASLYSAGTPIAQYLSAYQYMEANPNSVPSVTPPAQPVQCVALTVKAVDGTQMTFYLSAADASGISVSPPGAIISSVNSTNAITNTLTDVANFFQAHNQSTTPPPQPTPPPVVSTPQVSGNNVTIQYSSTGTAILITRNGTAISSTATLTTGTLVDQGLNPGTYQYTFVASKVGVQSTPVTVTATVSTPPPAQTNFAYNIQIPNVSNALQLITATNYGTGSQISFPARAFVKNILNQDVSTIPNTLNALFISNVGTTPNEVQVANALIGYFPTVPIQTGPKRSIIEIAGGIFAGLITLSLFTSGNKPKGKR